MQDNLKIITWVLFFNISLYMCNAYLTKLSPLYSPNNFSLFSVI